MREDHLDRAINEVARELTAGQPDAAFRTRVVARLAGGDAVPHDARAWWIVAPLAAAAAIALALALFSSRERSPVVTPTTARHETRAVPERPTTREVTPAGAAARRSAEKPDATYGSATSASAVAELAPPPLEVTSIAVAPIAGDNSLQLPQLETPQALDIAPLGADDIQRRD